MTDFHRCQFCGKEIRRKGRVGRPADYCSPHCANARRYLDAFVREMSQVDLDFCGSSVRSELFMIANTVVKAKNCRGRLELAPA